MSHKINDGLTNDQRWRQRHPEHAKALTRQNNKRWRAANPEQAKTLSRESYARHAEQRRHDARESFQKLKANGYSDARRLRQRMEKEQRRAILAGVEHDLTAVEWRDICQRFDYCCAYCGEKAALEQDHVIPLTKGGAHTASNIVPACKPCNSSKGNHADRPLRLRAISNL